MKAASDSTAVRATTAWAPGLPREIKNTTTNLAEVLRCASSGSPHLRREDIMEPKDIFLLHDMLNKEECLAITSECERIGFGKTNYPKLYRGNTRLMTSDPGLADALWHRIRDIAPATVHENGVLWQCTGINECFRFSKYVAGDIFQEHVDVFFKRTADEKSMYTINLYLNGHAEFEGGHTRFVKGQFGSVEHSVQPIAGMALVFRQPEEAEYWHDGELLRSGVKYLLRSDIMYTKTAAMQMQGHSCREQETPHTGSKRRIADVDRDDIVNKDSEKQHLAGGINVDGEVQESNRLTKKGKL
jgi:hypothetical protein